MLNRTFCVRLPVAPSEVTCSGSVAAFVAVGCGVIVFVSVVRLTKLAAIIVREDSCARWFWRVRSMSASMVILSVTFCSDSKHIEISVNFSLSRTAFFGRFGFGSEVDAGLRLLRSLANS